MGEAAMGRRPIGAVAMTPAERQKRHRERLAEERLLRKVPELRREQARLRRIVAEQQAELEKLNAAGVLFDLKRDTPKLIAGRIYYASGSVERACRICLALQGMLIHGAKASTVADVLASVTQHPHAR
jgi:hypothetical protein